MALSKQSLLAAVVGFVLGLVLSQLLSDKQALGYRDDVLSVLQRQWEQIRPILSTQPPSGLHLEGQEGPKDPVIFHDDSHVHEGEDLLAQQLAKEVRVLCWIMTGPENHVTKAAHVKATWGRRCNKLLFMSSTADPALPSVALEVQEGRDNLWAKTKQAFRYVHTHHLDEADWFVKADDDTYMIVENLRFLLKDKNTSDPVFFGHKFKPYVDQGYFSGGAGYVLSKEALKRFVGSALTNGTLCRESDGGAEDVEMGKCMENIGVVAGDSRDKLGQKRFFPFVPEAHLMPGHYPDWYLQYMYYKEEEGFGRMSDYAISFHYVPPNMMYVMDYLIYHLRPYGVNAIEHPEDKVVPKL